MSFPHHALAAFGLAAALCPPHAAAQSAADKGAMSTCLIEAAGSGQPGFVCIGTEYRRCMGEIEAAGGNLGTRAGTTCAQAEISAWLDAWTLALEAALWNATDKEATLARFAQIQARTADACLRVFDENAIPMIVVSECFGIAYGPFLAEELSAGR